MDKAIKYIPNIAENIIPISLYKIITILKQDINKQKIKELIREKQEEHQINIINTNNIILPIKNIKEELPIPPLLDRAVNHQD